MTTEKKEYSPEGKTLVTKADILARLRELGIEPGHSVFFHNSLSSMGYVVGGAQTVIDAFLEAVGPRGTVAVHTCHFRGPHWDHVRKVPKPVFDVRHTPSVEGRITEVFRHQPGAIRCLDSSNPMCAIGAHAAYLAADSIKAFTPCGRDTAWGKLLEIDAHYMFLGTGWGTCTLMHAVEEYGYAPYVFMDEPSRLEVIDEQGRRHTHLQKVHTPGIPRNWARMESELASRGMLREGRIGDARVLVMKARDLVELGTRLIVEDPGYFVKDRRSLETCRDNQRGLI